MNHPLVEYLLARYDEEDPTRTNPAVNERRDQVTELECRIITGDDPYLLAPGVSERDVAWWGLRVAGFMYRERDDFQDEWRVWPDPSAEPTAPQQPRPDEEPTP